jgi:hypothetical protein
MLSSIIPPQLRFPRKPNFEHSPQTQLDQAPSGTPGQRNKMGDVSVIDKSKELLIFCIARY